MDRLDRFSIWAIALLVISSSALISHNMGEAKPGLNAPRKQETRTNFAEADGRMKAARNLLEGNNLAKAEVLVRELTQAYPYEGEPWMLLGDVLMRRQQIIDAVLAYKEAVDLNPDYLDRKTPFFQGKKLKRAVNEALGELDGRIKTGGGDDVKKMRKTMYYLQRRIAGSCG